MFATRSLARRIEHAEAALVGDGAAAAAARTRDDGPFVRRLNGGVAAFTEPGAPLNKVIGLGFEGVPSASDLAEVEAAYAARGCPVTVELSAQPRDAASIGAAALVVQASIAPGQTTSAH